MDHYTEWPFIERTGIGAQADITGEDIFFFLSFLSVTYRRSGLNNFFTICLPRTTYSVKFLVRVFQS